MSDLISRDALNEALSDWNLMIILSAEEAQKTGEWRVVMPRAEVLRRLMNAPTVDNEPVVHARWEYIEDYAYSRIGWHCTSCRKRILNEMVAFAKYCPNCGAKMDGGADDGEG